jgi:hypothetical protein
MREAAGACRRARAAGSACVTRSPDSPLCERRTGLGGPTAAARPHEPDATRPTIPVPLVNSPG